jgi:hypothetical protein
MLHAMNELSYRDLINYKKNHLQTIDAEDRLVEGAQIE